MYHLGAAYLQSPGASGKCQSDEFLSNIKNWEQRAPVGEDRAEVAKRIESAYRFNSKTLSIRDMNITEFPPIPRNIISLEIVRCSSLKTLSGDLSQLTKLDILDSGNLTEVSANLESLQDLGIYRCRELADLGFIARSRNLEWLMLRNLDNFKKFELNMPPLVDMGIHDCKNLTQFQCNLRIEKPMSQVEIKNCGDIESLVWQYGIGNFSCKNNSQQFDELKKRGIFQADQKFL